MFPNPSRSLTIFFSWLILKQVKLKASLSRRNRARDINADFILDIVNVNLIMETHKNLIKTDDINLITEYISRSFQGVD